MTLAECLTKRSEDAVRGLLTVYSEPRQTRLSVYADLPGEAKLVTLLSTLANMTGTTVSQHISVGVDGKVVDLNAPIADLHIHEGSWITLQHSTNPPIEPYAHTKDQSGLVQLRFISGINAGSIYDVSPGTLDLGELVGEDAQQLGTDVTLEITDTNVVIIPTDTHGLSNQPRGWLRRVLSRFRREKNEIHTGIFVGTSEVTARKIVEFGEEITLPHAIIAITNERDGQVPLDEHSSPEHFLFARPPKIHLNVKKRKFTLPSRPAKPTKSPIPIAATMLPLVMSVAMAYFQKNMMFLAFGIMSPIMMLASYISGNRSGRRRYKQAVVQFEKDTKKITAQAREAVELEIAADKIEYPDPTAVLDICSRHTARLWNRRVSDDSWLSLRVGTGDKPSSVTLEKPGLHEAERTQSWQLNHHPITISLAQAGCVGCTGALDTMHPVLAWMICQLAALHSTRDLSMYLLAPRPSQTDQHSQSEPETFSRPRMDWNFTQWLPHLEPLQGQDCVRKVAVTAETIAVCIAQLLSILDERTEARHQQSMRKWSGSAIVIIMDNPHKLRTMPGIIRLLQEGPEVGIYTLCLDIDERLLPEECQTIITAHNGIVSVRSNVSDDVDEIMPDLVSEAWIDAISLALAPIEDGSPDDSESSIPTSSRLLSLLELTPTAQEVSTHWAMQPHSTICVIGESVDGPICLDIAKDGPHGLIAGTTGSGKSELLQSLVASLAVANTPDAMNFVLVDFKGGAAFKDCVQLPHTVGMVTDLDNHLVTRALISLGAELTYREHLLAQAGAKDIDDYLDMRETNPTLATMPRLLIVIDEFASLARELPDFVTGLVNIAQRGRSLGIHLVLATQRPGGVVSPEIRANANLRIALRMTDATESEDVIDAKDAAMISKHTPGRAVMRLGSNSLVPFQSARVGGRYATRGQSERPQTPERPFICAMPLNRLSGSAPQRKSTGGSKSDVTVTDLKKLVESIGQAAADASIPKQRQPWMPALPEQIDLVELERDESPMDQEANAGKDNPAIPFALGDYPQQQKQEIIAIDPEHFGNLFIIGTTRSGKSTALRTIAYEACTRYSSARLHLHCIDCGNGAIMSLGALPNVGVMATRSDSEKILHLVDKLSRECKNRAARLSQGGFASIAEFNQNASFQECIAHIFVLLDSWEGFTTVFQSFDGGSLIDKIQTLLREGSSAGIHFIITGDRQLLSGRMSILSERKIMLRMVDKADYSGVGIPSREVPDDIADGRGFLSENSTEVQIARIDSSVNGQQESARIRETGQRLAAQRDVHIPREQHPFHIEELPQELWLRDLQVHKPDVGQLLESEGAEPPIPLGLGGENNDMVLWRPSNMPMLPIYGSRGSGKTTALITLANGALSLGYHIVIIAPRNNALRSFRNAVGVDQVIMTADEVTEELFTHYLDQEDGTGQTILIADDCHMLKDIPASQWLQRQVGVLEFERLGMVFAGDTSDFPQGFGNWGNKLKSLKQGVLLKPSDLMEAGLIGAHLKRSDINAAAPKGRGFAHLNDATVVSVQIARSEPITSSNMPPRPAPATTNAIMNAEDHANSGFHE